MRSSRNIIVVAAAIVVLALIGLGVYQWRTGDGGALPSAQRPDDTSASSEADAPAEPDWCPAVEVASVPGTWESAADDDPFNPQANPASFMLSITTPLQQMYDLSLIHI